jgi:heme-degrading monooxygenase HmoA
MARHFASGNWHVTEGMEDEFVERWKEFLGWTRESQPALVNASLLRDEKDPAHFISFAEWSDAAGRDAWRQSPEFGQHFGACRSLCRDMSAGDYEWQVSF